MIYLSNSCHHITQLVSFVTSKFELCCRIELPNCHSFNGCHSLSCLQIKCIAKYIKNICIISNASHKKINIEIWSSIESLCFVSTLKYRIQAKMMHRYSPCILIWDKSNCVKIGNFFFALIRQMCFLYKGALKSVFR